ncbi:MAG: arginase [Anaerolineales bacterium]
MIIDLIGVPMDFGAGRRGVDMGPSAIRIAGLRERLETLGHEVNDLGNLDIPLPETSRSGDSGLRYADAIVAVSERVAQLTAESLRRDHLPLTLGGDHSLALGSVHGAARARRLGVIWMDAHGDFNTAKTSPSGNIHGMPLAALCGYGDARIVNLGQSPGRGVVDPANVAVVGVRNLDAGERELLRTAGVRVFATEQIDRTGMHAAMQSAVEIASRGTDGIYLSFDLDALDPVYAPGVGTPVPGGLTYREAHLACELVSETGRLVAMEIVEVNPILDVQNATAVMAVSLAASAAGQRVWR